MDKIGEDGLTSMQRYRSNPENKEKIAERNKHYRTNNKEMLARKSIDWYNSRTDEQKETIRAKNRARYAKNRTPLLKKSKVYKSNNKEYIRAYKKRYRAANLEKLKAYADKYRADRSQNKEKKPVLSAEELVMKQDAVRERRKSYSKMYFKNNYVPTPRKPKIVKPRRTRVIDLTPMNLEDPIMMSDHIVLDGQPETNTTGVITRTTKFTDKVKAKEKDHAKYLEIKAKHLSAHAAYMARQGKN